MRRTVPILLLAVAFALAAAQAAPAAMRDEPRDFRGVPFGKQFVPDSTFACELDSEEGLRCTRKGEDMRFLGSQVTSVSYLFMYKQLYTVDIETHGRASHDAIMAELTRLHGEPGHLPGGMTAFTGTQVDILAFFDAGRDAGEISYVFKNLPCPVE